jgi:hypothetical protein
MSKTYSDEELMFRVWDVEEIKKVVHKRVYYIADDRRSDELSDLWVSDPVHQKTASFGRNWGYYVGMDEIKQYYIDRHKAHLERQKIENKADGINIGNLYAHPASTGLVELSGDRKTAKGMWYCISQETTALPDGTADARWMLEKLAIDFVREDSGWKIWHLVIATDLHSEAGEDYSKQPVYIDWNQDVVKQEFGAPTIEALTHDSTFNWWDGYPFMPTPYETFSDAISYGPEGFVPPVNKGLNANEGRNFR